MGRYETFVIRLWTDGRAGFEHGEIRHVMTGRGFRFRSVQDAFSFIRGFETDEEEEDRVVRDPRLTSG